MALELFGGITQSTSSFTSGSGAVLGNHRGVGGGVDVVLHSTGVGLELGAAFVQKGLTATAGGKIQTVKTGYAEVPLLLRAYFGGHIGGGFLLAGTEASYEITCEETIVGSGTTISNACADDANFNNHIRFDYGLIAGVGARLGSLTVQVRYDIGLRKLYASGGASGSNRSVMAFGGVTF